MTAERRFLARLLVCMGVVAATIVTATSTASAFAGGTGTSGDPYQISTCAHLLEIDDTTGNLSKSYLLTGNIDCTGTTWTPLKNGSTYFTGTLSGGSRTVSGLAIMCAANDCGMFAQLRAGAVIQNLTIAAPTVSSSHKNVGLIAGASSGAVTIRNITVTGGSVTSTYVSASRSDKNTVGGIIGSAGVADISNITSSMSVTGGNEVGGIVASGLTAGLNISDVTVNGNVTGESWVGGVVGNYYNAAAYGLVITRAQVGTVSVSGLQNVGGFLGYGWNIKIDRSSSRANVNGVGTLIDSSGVGDRAYVGGFAGQLSGGDSTFVDSWAIGNVTATDGDRPADSVGGMLGWARLTNLYVTRSSYVGDVSGANFVGGMVGQQGLAVYITDSYSRSNITSTAASPQVGGFVGTKSSGTLGITRSFYAGTQSPAAASRHGIVYSNSFGTVSCTGVYFDSTVLGSTKTSSTANVCGGNGGAASKTTAEMKSQATFSGYDFTPGTAVWTIDSTTNSGYPYLDPTGVTPPDTTAPTLTSGSLLANGQTVRLVFNEAIHATTAPASAFTVTASAVNHTPTAVAVSGSNIDLTLPVTLEGTATLTVSYVAPASNSATSNAAVQDLAGNDAASFSNRSVTNNSTADATAPTVTWTSPSTPSSTRTLSYTLTFSEAVSGIVSGDFRVLGTATGCAVTPSAASTSTSITVSVTCSSDGTVLLELLSNTVVDGSSNTGPSVNATATQITINTSVATTTTAAPAPTTTVTGATTTPAPTTTATGTATTTTVVTQSGGTTAGPVPGSPSASATTVARSGSPSATSTSVASSTGGGASAAVVPTTTTEPEVTSTVVAAPASTLPVIDVPKTEVGGASALIGGVEVAAKVSREDNELIVDVGPIVARIWATARSGGKVPLDAEGRLRLQVGDSVTVDIEGFDAATPVEVRLYSDPVLLGRSQVGASGTLAAAYEIPEGVEQGDHTVVLVGTGKGDSVTLGLSVAIGDEPTGINPWVIIVPIGLAVLGALLLPVALRRRRREAAA